MKPTAPLRNESSVLATTPYRGLSLSRWAVSLVTRTHDKLIRVRAFAVALFVVLGTIVPSATFAGDKAAERAQSQAQEMAQAFMRGDVHRFVYYTHPRFVEVWGGKAKVIQTIRSALANLHAKGFAIRSATVAAPRQIVRPKSGMVQVIIPNEVITVGGGYEYRGRSYLFGLSSDGGQTWKFVDTGRDGGRELRQLFPECSPKLKIPEA
jgi:hypothetical protein